MAEPKHGKEFKFTFYIDLYHLIDLEGMENMNEYMDTQLAKEYPNRNIILTDIDYKMAPSFKEPASTVVGIQASGIIEDMEVEEEDA